MFSATMRDVEVNVSIPPVVIAGLVVSTVMIVGSVRVKARKRGYRAIIESIASAAEGKDVEIVIPWWGMSQWYFEGTQLAFKHIEELCRAVRHRAYRDDLKILSEAEALRIAIEILREEIQDY